MAGAVIESLAGDGIQSLHDIRDIDPLQGHPWSAPPADIRFVASCRLPGDVHEPAICLVVADDQPRQLTDDQRRSLEQLADLTSQLPLRELRRDDPDGEHTKEQEIRELKSSNQKLEEFAYVASHDLQEPLRMITGFLGLLDDEYGSAFDTTAREYVDYAVDGARRMKDMIDALLAYSRMWSTDESFVRTDAEPLLREAVDQAKQSHPDVDATITWRDIPVVTARPDQLRRLFTNLLTNAIKYAGDAPKIDVQCRQDAEFWRFSVRDEGPGIAPAHRERIFEVFASGPDQSRQDSTGIGLSICKAIVEGHGGRIWVDSADDGGAIFHFTLLEQSLTDVQ